MATTIVFDPQILAGTTPIQRFEHPMGLLHIMNSVGVPDPERVRIITDGFDTMRELVTHYSGDTNAFKVYLEGLNKTFATAPRVENRIYFNPLVLAKLVGVIYYFDITYNCLHLVPDVLDVTPDNCITYSRNYRDFCLQSDKDDGEDTLDLPKLQGASNWVTYRDAFLTKLSLSLGARGLSLNYVVDSTTRLATRANSPRQPTEPIDTTDDDLITTKATHIGPAYKADNSAVWNRIKSSLLNQPPYNHIASFDRTKNGRGAWNALKAFYEGEDFMQRNQDKAFALLSTTFYKGESTRFTFEKYVNVHKQAHKMLLDSGYNLGNGMDDSTKVQHLKSNIRPDAGLESSLSQVRSHGVLYQDFTRLVSYLSAEVEHLSLRRQQTRGGNPRQVSALEKKNRDKRNRDKKKTPPNTPSEMVEGKRIFGKHYNPNEFRNLSRAQKDAVAKMRRNNQPRNDNNLQASAATIITQDSLSQMEERIVAGVIRAGQSNQDLDAETEITDTQSQSSSGTRRRSAPSGGVGNFIGAQRRRPN